jgi:hypothetical protein
VRGRLPHPAVLAERERRAGDLHLRVADTITAFAGSMTFVYLHAVAFSVWMLALERSPWPTLTLVVSLEALTTAALVDRPAFADSAQSLRLLGSAGAPTCRPRSASSCGTGDERGGRRGVERAARVPRHLRHRLSSAPCGNLRPQLPGSGARNMGREPGALVRGAGAEDCGPRGEGTSGPLGG